MTAVLVATALTVLVNRGFPGRFSDELNRIFAVENPAVPDVDTATLRTGILPVFGDTHSNNSCIVWGDSHAKHLLPGVERAALATGHKCVMATHSATPPILGFVPYESRYSLNEATPEWSEALVERAVKDGTQCVILAGRWTIFAENTNFEQQLRETLKTLAANNFRTMIVLDVPGFEVDVPRSLVRSRLLGLPDTGVTQSSEAYLSPTGAGSVNEMIRRVAKETGAMILDPAPYLQNEAGEWTAFLNGECLYTDFQHLSIEGGRRLQPMFEAAFKKLRPQVP